MDVIKESLATTLKRSSSVPMARKAGRALRLVMAAVVLATAMLTITATPAAASDCIPSTGCVPKENGTGAWWADSASKGHCNGQPDLDWLVTYRTDNSYWLRADINKIRFGAASWSKVDWPWPYGATQAAATDVSPPGITLCFGGGRYSQSDVLGTYVRLRP